MKNRDLQNPNTPLPEIYDDILKFYFTQGFLQKVTPSIRYLFTGKNYKAKLVNYLTPFFKFIKRHFEYKKHFQPYLTDKNLTNKIWLFANSINNRNSLKFLLDELEDTILVGNGVQIDAADKYQLPFHRTILYIWKFPKIWLFFKNKYGNQATQYSDLIFKTVGLYEISYQYLSKYRPKCIILSNDHSEKQRALLNAAKRLNIPVIYIQHASISDFMPPLDFDLSLLESQAAFDKYKSLGEIKGEVQLIGMPKFDDYINLRNYSTTIKNIGVCTNLLDQASDISLLLQTIQEEFPDINLSFRPHPGYKVDFSPPKSIYHSTKSEYVFDFLKKQDLIIAGSSSVHLEATLLNITSIYFQISPVAQNTHDPYGYIKNGLVQEVNNIPELLSIIQENINYREPVFQNTKYFDATIGTKNEGKSRALAAKYIKKFLAGKNLQNNKCAS